MWCGTRWLCRPCQARTNRERKARLSKEQLEAERIRGNELRNFRRALWTTERRDAANAQTQAWREANRERHREGSRDWYHRNIERARAKKLAEYYANPQAFMARNLVRKARINSAVCEHGSGCVTADFLQAIYTQVCEYCGAAAEHADHFIPLAKDGLHCRDNLVPACSPCNLSKQARDPIEWLESLTA